MAVEHIVAHAATEDFAPWVSLRVLNQHAVADYSLIEFYERCGFVETEDVSEEPWYKRRSPDNPVTARVFQLTDIGEKYTPRSGAYLKALLPGRVVKVSGPQEAQLQPLPLKPRPPLQKRVSLEGGEKKRGGGRGQRKMGRRAARVARD